MNQAPLYSSTRNPKPKQNLKTESQSNKKGANHQHLEKHVFSTKGFEGRAAEVPDSLRQAVQPVPGLLGRLALQEFMFGVYWGVTRSCDMD